MIRSIKTYSYRIDEKFGEIKKVDSSGYKVSVKNFDEKGNIIQYKEFNFSGEIEKMRLYEYDNNYNLTEIKMGGNYNVVFTLNEQGIRIRSEMYFGYNLVSTRKYDKNGYLIEEKRNSDDGDIKSFKYDEYGNEIEMITNGSRFRKYDYKYNVIGRIIERKEYSYNDNITSVLKNNYNDKGILIVSENVGYDYDDGKVSYKLKESYDIKGNIIESVYYRQNYTKYEKFTYEFNENGDWIIKNCIENEIAKMQIERIIEYYPKKNEQIEDFPRRVLLDDLVQKNYDGDLETKIYYYKGNLFTGIAYDIYFDGQIKWESNCLNGFLDGVSRRWHANGNLKFETNIKNGRPHGITRTWYENGQLEREGNLKNGLYDGILTIWWAHGELKVKGNYINGKKDGIHIHGGFKDQPNSKSIWKNGFLIKGVH